MKYVTNNLDFNGLQKLSRNWRNVSNLYIIYKNVKRNIYEYINV